MADFIAVQEVGGVVTQGEDAAIAVPSGQEVSLLETIWNAPGPEGRVTRFRFVAPAINRETGTVDFETASEDLRYLCENFALQRVVETGPAPSQIIVSMADRALPFAEANPDATQYFEAFRVEDGACIWEVF